MSLDEEAALVVVPFSDAHAPPDLDAGPEPSPMEAAATLAEELGARVARVRGAAGLSRRKLAGRLGWGVTQLARIERGTSATRHGPTLATLLNLARALDVSLDYLAGHRKRCDYCDHRFPARDCPYENGAFARDQIEPDAEWKPAPGAP